MTRKLGQQLKRVPEKPGVYLFYFGKAPIYIGKAVNLKARVKSYFQNKDLGFRIQKMVSLVDSLNFILTDSEIEALILEADLIKKYQPKYNVKAKDAKSYLYLAINFKEDFPGVYFTRGGDFGKKGFRYFGPYTSADNLRQAVRFLRRIFPFKSCQKMTRKTCLWYHLGRCQGPCEGKISKTEYRADLEQFIEFLKGGKKRLIKNLEKAMRTVSKKKNFEKAAVLRDKIFSLKHLQNVWLSSSKIPQKVPHRIECYDISNLAGKFATGSMAVFTDGEPDKSQYRKFRIKTVKKISDTEMLAEVLKRRYRHLEWSMPNLVIIDGGKGQLNVAQKVILESINLNIPLVAIAKGQDKKDQLFFQGKKVLPDQKLIQRVRDEAHRVALKYHRWLRSKNLLKKS